MNAQRFKKLASTLYIQVIVGLAAGILLGYFYPDIGVELKPLGDLFIKLIKMLLAPIIFASVVVGIARMGSVRETGRVGAKAMLYFEICSTLSLVLSLIVVNLMKPGVGMNIDPTHIDTASIKSYTLAAQHHTTLEFLMNIVPNSVVGAFAQGDMLQIILFSLLFSFALNRLGSKVTPLIDGLDMFLHGMFGVVRIVMHLAPIGAFGGIAFTIAKYGIGTLNSFAELMAAVYLTCILFVVLVLGTVMRYCRVPLWGFLKYIKDEILIVLGTASTEAVLPQMMQKMEAMGCQKKVVGLVLPTGYTFNADGTAIYLAMAAIFIAQATNIDLTIWEQLGILGVMMLTSKGSAGVAGAGFVALAATLASMHKIPLSGLVLLVGIDRFLNEARAVTNLIGNGVATIAVARWEGALDLEQMNRAFAASAAGRDVSVPTEVAPLAEKPLAVPGEHVSPSASL
ncbi:MULTISPECIES: C4-dicarboxylate transporter DctA [unclassified Janthinobacterium]|uniref:C4-dicarboxylate transporter DctA n=1 Tax=unclassified Janthinobacterium TaxID=2610881 RepID=UPI00161AF569|nr:MULTISPECIES: C4-dicarboxylate transporter DctA [unclassified Janthinobacterium]MBB5369957.1 DAACS family dicarboxylate/amino acid:cation (Na+ or H+) symporter/aerobic C4-dicarboxylate transport protein [Janthinobacterium sp. K2C7]MBB5382763.1 DAACS family dicarboxylate/amino acid:cation (Na+ or H+) symporter/aerobic C4-dicarboxylate transport protein [Janthinobacterium sp. K2Li3]MBB5384748.1 DAACS family dicarboxylate/amino acid:cation (Na+ or H+) symporter/aerobic C4-dicarboxylate transport